MIITVIGCATDLMILWQSQRVEVNRGNHGQASASGDDDQHELLGVHELDDQRGSAAPEAAATYDHLPDSGWTVLPARPVARG
jgi:hypothetical protein